MAQKAFDIEVMSNNNFNGDIVLSGLEPSVFALDINSIIINPATICYSSSITVGGKILNENAKPHQDVEVRLIGVRVNGKLN